MIFYMRFTPFVLPSIGFWVQAHGGSNPSLSASENLCELAGASLTAVSA